MDYRDIMGVKELSRENSLGAFVRIAIVDSGMPPAVARIGWHGYSRMDQTPCPDRFGHATEVASILFGGRGIVGLCENSVPIFVKALDDDGYGDVESVSRGIIEAIEKDADIINLSLGFMRTEECPKDLEWACNAAYEAGKTVICAAGNDGGLVNWPAALKTTICVGSSAENGIKNVFSSVGEVDFVAPGENLTVLGLNGCGKKVSGTSFSAAMVSGVAALLVHGMKMRGCQAKMDAVKDALVDMSQDVDEPGWDSRTGYGVIAAKMDDSTTNMKMRRGFFGRILERTQILLGLKKKERTDGRFRLGKA